VARGVKLLPQDCDNGDGTATILLFDRWGQKTAETIIDAEDLERVLELGRWGLLSRNKHGRYVRHQGTINGKKVTTHLHRFIMDCPDGYVVDHINRDTLDNRKSNLRILTPNENSANRNSESQGVSGYRGVYLYRKLNRYGARYNGKHLGMFATAEEANEVAKAYRLAHTASIE